MIKYDDNVYDKFTNNHSLNINCLNNMDIAGSINLNKVLIPTSTPSPSQPENHNNLNINVGNTMIMRDNSSISINHYGSYHSWNHLLFQENEINTSQESNIMKYGGKDINITCNNLIMAENCSIDSIGHHGGNITIKANENIDMYHEPHNDGNIICSIGIDQKYGVGGNIIIECNELNLSKLQSDFDSRIESIGKYKNGKLTIRAKIISGDIANVKPNTNITNSPKASTIILY
mmetsp:Transcript_20758/g.18310  ORF Transcript_20758/g.18310 Transcript_20758/m.18310 type:complete len:233 (-) Transcript_20758:115-813(-)